MKGIKGTQGYVITGLVDYTRPIGKEPVAVWMEDTLQRGGDYQPIQVIVSAPTAAKHLKSAPGA